MNIIIATSIQSDSGYEEKLLTNLLLSALKKLNYKVDFCLLPYHRDMIALPEQIIAYQMMKGLDCDMLITIGYPAIYLNHPNKVSYFFQLVPMLYEYYNTEFGVLANTQYEKIKNSVHVSDNIIFRESKKIFVNSDALRNQIKSFYDIDTEVFYLPDLVNENNQSSLQSNYIVAETDLLPESRYEILFDVIANNNISLLLSVPRTSNFYREVLNRRIEASNLKDKIKVIDKPLSKEILNSAKCYVSLNYHKTKISNGLVRSSIQKVPIIVANDSLAECEIEAINQVKPDAENYSNAINLIKQSRVYKVSIQSLDVLAIKMVKI